MMHSWQKTNPDELTRLKVAPLFAFLIWLVWNNMKPASQTCPLNFRGSRSLLSGSAANSNWVTWINLIILLSVDTLTLPLTHKNTHGHLTDSLTLLLSLKLSRLYKRLMLVAVTYKLFFLLGLSILLNDNCVWMLYLCCVNALVV